MTAENAGVADSDPLKVVADAMDAAVKAAKDGVEEARATVAEAVPAASDTLSRMAYKSSYAISYGVVFASLFVARSIPKNNAIVNGFIDGAQAATDMVKSGGQVSHPASAQ
jgi:hypothetical protein